MHGGDVARFDRFARLYDLLMPAPDRAALGAGLERARRPVERVVDVGGGPGRAVRELEAPLRAVLDPADGMVRQARRNGLASIRGDGTRLPLRTASVDCVLVTDALHHIADHRAVMRESRRVLRPGGVLVVREFDPSTLRGRALVAAERLLAFESTFHTPDALAADVASAGLESSVLERGFSYTVVGVAPESETHKSAESK